jgi:hypothetical protein
LSATRPASWSVFDGAGDFFRVQFSIRARMGAGYPATATRIACFLVTGVG